MGSESAHDLTKTYFCKAAGCENESRSPVGRYSYCPEHQGSAARASAPRPPAVRRASGGTEGALRDLLAFAKRVDQAKVKAEKAQRVANEANRKADELEAEYTEALAQATRAALRVAA